MSGIHSSLVRIVAAQLCCAAWSSATFAQNSSYSYPSRTSLPPQAQASTPKPETASESGPSFSFRASAPETGAARTPQRGLFGGAPLLLPTGVNPYGYAYHFGNGDRSINTAATYWLWNEAQRGRAATSNSAAASAPNPSRAASSGTTARFGSNQGGTASTRFNANPYAAGSRIAHRFNNYGGRFSNVSRRR